MYRVPKCQTRYKVRQKKVVDVYKEGCVIEVLREIHLTLRVGAIFFRSQIFVRGKRFRAQLVRFYFVCLENVFDKTAENYFSPPKQ